MPVNFAWIPITGSGTSTPMDLLPPASPNMPDNSALAQLDAEEKLLDDAAKAAELNEAMAACQGKDH